MRARVFTFEMARMLNGEEPRFHVNRIAFEAMTKKLEDTGFKINGRPRVFLSRAVVMMRKGV